MLSKGLNCYNKRKRSSSLRHKDFNFAKVFIKNAVI